MNRQVVSLKDRFRSLHQTDIGEILPPLSTPTSENSQHTSEPLADSVTGFDEYRNEDSDPPVCSQPSPFTQNKDATLGTKSSEIKYKCFTMGACLVGLPSSG
eukprot:GHVT01057557.1.p1 GENE.GHVT01057557.1~~GHVT01057557.1.p1  ORF type:complete len:102 (+),score=4.67 GHVT01057557.1:252-557(+)